MQLKLTILYSVWLISVGVFIFCAISLNHWYQTGLCRNLGVTQISTDPGYRWDTYSFQLTYIVEGCATQTKTFQDTDLDDITKLYQKYASSSSFNCYASKFDKCDYQPTAKWQNAFAAGIFISLVCFGISFFFSLLGSR